MRKTKRWTAALAAFFVLLMTACSASGPGGQQDAPMTGGDDQLGENVNLRDVSIEMQGDTTLVNLSFVNGSRYSDVPESKISTVPSYEVLELSDPARVCVSLAIGLSDFAQSGTVFQESMVVGLFDCDIAGSTMKQLYLQLSGPAHVSCRVKGSTLTLVLSPRNESKRSAWFVGLNAIAQYMNGLVPADLEFAPTMCDDFSNVILISRPLGNERDAQRVLEDAAQQLPSSIPESALYTFEMDINGLPPFHSIAGADLAAAMSVLQVNGEQRSLDVLLDNGKYLTTKADGTIVYAVPYLPNAQEDTEQVVKEELWVRRNDGSHEQIATDDFYDVREATYSPDGRYLGILDARPTDQVLFVFDNATGQLMNLGEEGLGNFTTSFVWDPSRNVIYAMSGADGALQLLRYDFDASGSEPRVSSVEERNGSDSTLQYANGTIYFADQQDMMICAVDVATGQRRQLAPGTNMRLSPDGRYLAVLVMRPLNEEDVTFDLVLLDAETGEQVASVAENVQVGDFMFDARLDNLYYTTQDYEGVTPDFPFALLRYSISDGVSELVGYCRSELIDVAAEPGTLYIVYYFASGDTTQNMLPVTYVLNVAE